MSLIGTIAAFCCCTVEEEGGVCCRGGQLDCECIEGLTKEECEDANMTGGPFDTGVFLPGVLKCPPPDVPDEENICLTGCCINNIPNSGFTCIDVACLHECRERGASENETTFEIPINTCDDKPDPCDNLGACCKEPEGQCFENHNAATCAGIGGEFHPGETCAQIECGSVPLINCCLPNGSCLENVELQACLDVGGHTIAVPCNTKPDPCVNEPDQCCNLASSCGTRCITIPAVLTGFPCDDGSLGPICWTPCVNENDFYDYIMCVTVPVPNLCCDESPVDLWQNLGGSDGCVPSSDGVHGSCIFGVPPGCESQIAGACLQCFPTGWEGHLEIVWSPNFGPGANCVCGLCACTADVFFPCPPNHCPDIAIVTNITTAGSQGGCEAP